MFWSFIFILQPFLSATVVCRFTIDVVPRRSELLYLNHKYLDFFNVTVRRANRQSPYVAHVDIQSRNEFGNNITVKLQLYENLSGRYNPTLVRYEYKLCDWLNKESVLGKLWASRLPGNATCPFPKTRLTFTSSFLNITNKYIIPFTWNNYCISTRMNVDVVATNTRELILKFNTHFDIIQKPM